MTRYLSALALAAAVTVAAGARPAAAADEHSVLAPGDMKWGAAPPSLPKGAEMAVLYGDPSKDGLFAVRLKLPKGYSIPPHSHPKAEVVTVMSGTFRIGMGDTADASKA